MRRVLFNVTSSKGAFESSPLASGQGWYVAKSSFDLSPTHMNDGPSHDGAIGVPCSSLDFAGIRGSLMDKETRR